MLKNGSKAPHFSLLDGTGNTHQTPDPKYSTQLLIFHRGQFCPTTDRFLTAYQDIYPRLKELGVGIFAISTDSKEENLGLQERLRIKFPLLSDADFKCCEAYGIYRGEHRNGTPYAEPGVVLIDKDLEVCYSVISSGPKGLASPGDILPVLLYMHSHGGKY